MTVTAPHSPWVRLNSSYSTKTCHIHRWDVGNFLHEEMNPKLHRGTEEGGEEKHTTYFPSEITLNWRKTLIKAAAALKRKYHTGS